MKVLLLSPLLQQTGNNTSSHRIKSYVTAGGYEVDLQDCYQFESSSKFNEHLRTSKPDCILAVHAYRSGALLQECTLPFALVFGGTDLNEHFKSESKMRVMTCVVHKAKFLVAFSKPLYNQAKHLWPDVSSRLVLQPQAVKTSPDGSFNFVQHLQSSCSIQVEVIIFLLLAGLRPVKDVLYLTQAFSEWHLEENAVHLVIAGPELDGTYSDQVRQVANSLPGVHLLPEMSLAHAHAAIKQSCALLNSSQSEGMSSTILEAMDLQVPVIARDIPGNKAIITHGETGLLFNNPKEFIQYAKCLRQDISFRKQIVQNAKEYLIKNHSTEKERATYCRIVAELVSKAHINAAEWINHAQKYNPGFFCGGAKALIQHLWFISKGLGWMIPSLSGGLEKFWSFDHLDINLSGNFMHDFLLRTKAVFQEMTTQLY